VVFNLDRFAREAAFDRREGVDTKTHLRFPTDPDPTSEQRSYLPLTPSHFRRAMRLLPISASLYTFTDLGCGKGTALILAVRAGFQRVIGVEIDPDLLATATANRERLVGRKPERFGRMELVAGDAAEFVPPDEPTVVLMFNPFGEKTLRKVLRNYAQNHSAIYIIYYGPHHAVFRESSVFQEIGRLRSNKTVVYSRHVDSNRQGGSQRAQ
jgi:predicted RNA methylase